VQLGQWLGLICLIIILVILWQIRQVLLLLFAAIVIATALNSLIRRLRRWGMRRKYAVMTTLGLSAIVTILFIALIVPTFIDQFVGLLRLLPPGFDRVVVWIDRQLRENPSLVAGFEMPSTTAIAQQLEPFVRYLIQNFFSFFSNSLTALVQVLFVIILSLMLLANPRAYRDVLIVLFPSFYRRRADQILTLCEVSLDNWLGGAVISSSGVAIMSAIGLWFLGLPYVLAQALLAGVLNFIPNIGPLISLAFPLIVAFQDAPWKAIAVFILYFVIQNVEAYLLTPTIMAKQVSLLPALTLTAQIFFASFFNFLGLLLALPLTVVAKTWIQEALIKDILDPWKQGYKPHRLEAQDFSEQQALAEFMDSESLPD
jgi:predicted PurR-regulated permease PerM